MPSSSGLNYSQQQQQHRQQQQQQQQLDGEYLGLKKPQKKVDRRHADPLVSFTSLLELILNELRDMPEAQPFLQPVNSKKVIDYYRLVKTPMDLLTVRKLLNDAHYQNRNAFVHDIQLLVDNSALYNGVEHEITHQARVLLSVCVERLAERREQLDRLEKQINPLLDDNSLHVLNFLLDKCFEKQIMTVENSFSFLKPVNKTKYKDYYEIVKRPIDLEAIKQKVAFKFMWFRLIKRD